MIHDLDATLKALLLAKPPDGLLPQPPLDSGSISFEPPVDKFPDKIPTVNLFLYDIRENRELRSNEWRLERQSDRKFKKEPPPVRVDCSYLITAWAESARDEHRLLGQIMWVLLRHRTIPEAYVKGELKGREPPLRTLPIQPTQLQSMSDFWQALGGKPKAALNYAVTISLYPFEKPEDAAVVTDKLIKIKQVVK